jgi:hypothetical protein
MIEPVEMRDAANWNAPGLDGWAGPVCGYPNRQPPWPPGEYARFASHMSTSVQAAPGWAKFCRELDIERFAAAPEDLPAFVLAREAFGHQDAGAYFSLSLWPAVDAVLHAAGIGPERIRLRIADWTGEPRRIVVEGHGGLWTAWAHQFSSRPDLGVDRNMVWGAQDFSR